MNYIFGCNNKDRFPSRFYGRDWETHCFNFATRLDNEGKWRNIRRMLLSMTIQPGGVFWFPDPDLEFEDGLPCQLFESVMRHDLTISQPALTEDSACSHHQLICQKHNDPRPVDFSEIMCPLFSYAALQRNLWTFDLNYSGFGIDYLWGRKEKCTVLDWLTVRHPSSPGYHNTAVKIGFPDPRRELAEVQRLYL